MDAACRQVYDRVDDLYEDWCPDISTHTFTTAEFDALRTSLPHMAGQVQRYGLTLEGERLPAMAQNNSWSGIQGFLKACQRHLIESLQQYGQGEKPIPTLYYAQAALEVAVPGPHVRCGPGTALAAPGFGSSALLSPWGPGPRSPVFVTLCNTSCARGCRLVGFFRY
ncbi:MAG: hypothetical protein OXC13_14335 [Caldilineaceae bacterium]|nr:hypothetical protein [Caldilineaceae bacterium]